MNRARPEDDPIAVALIAQGFLAQCEDRCAAIQRARELIAACRAEIASQATTDELWLEMIEECGGYPDDVPMSEERFLQLLCAGLIKENRIDRLRSFVRRRWTDVRNRYADAPDITNQTNWTRATLYFWRHTFSTVVKSERVASNKANAGKKKQDEKKF
jgi:hypothetical protein